MSENVTPMSETGGCDNTVLFPTLTLLSELSQSVPIRSDFVSYDGPRLHTRGVEWGDSSIEGSRVLLVYDHRGKCVKEEHIAIEYADDASEDAAWRWLNDHCPRAPEVEQQLRNMARPEPTEYPPLQLVK